LKKDADYLTRREKNIPLKRIGTPEDIAHAALFLATPESSYITGVDLLIDGGMSSAFRED
jgi:NAD(P)-dependent dehydrogenase (short-subunit alcohol dehydrogenase family)